MVLVLALILRVSNGLDPPIAPLRVNVGLPAPVASPASIVRLSTEFAVLFPFMVLGVIVKLKALFRVHMDLADNSGAVSGVFQFIRNRGV